jgi:hypothetical protein
MQTFKELEARRQRAGLGIGMVCERAQISKASYHRLLNENQVPRTATLQRVNDALNGKVHQRADEGQLIRAHYNVAVLKLGRLLGIDGAKALASDPHHRAPSNREWAAAAKLQELATYCVVTGLDVRAARMARAIGLTKQAVSLRLHRVEDLREDDRVIDRALDVMVALWQGRRL